MTDESLGLAVSLAQSLPPADVGLLADALAHGPDQVGALRAAASNARLRDACTRLLAAAPTGQDRLLLAGALLGAESATAKHRSESSVEVVWTGPSSTVTTGRLTAAVIVGLIEEARRDVLLIGYAVHSEPSVLLELQRAAARGVEITLVLERHADNPAYSASGTAFPGLTARRLAWPLNARPGGTSSLHAKVLVIDGRSALVGSANITGSALERNLECGLLLRGEQARTIRGHVRSLEQAGVLRPATQTVAGDQM